MKYISLILFVVALGWTWHLVHSESPVSFETHSGIQEKLAQLITETIKSKRSGASDIVVQKIWTEVINQEKVKAFFVYSFKDQSESGVVSSEIRGEGLLERQGLDEAGNDRWVLSQVRTSSDAIQFEDAMIVTGLSQSESTTEATPAATAAPAETPAQTPAPEKQ